MLGIFGNLKFWGLRRGAPSSSLIFNLLLWWDPIQRQCLFYFWNTTLSTLFSSFTNYCSFSQWHYFVSFFWCLFWCPWCQAWCYLLIYESIRQSIAHLLSWPRYFCQNLDPRSSPPSNVHNTRIKSSFWICFMFVKRFLFMWN